MKRFFSLATGLLLGLLSAGCGLNCRDQTCDCFSEGEDDVFLLLDLDSLSRGFRKAELRGAYVVRYASPGFGSALDTVRQSRQNQFLDFYETRGVLLNNLFAPLPTKNFPFTAYNYAMVLPQVNRRYEISDLELAGETRGSNCCRCYRNTRKRLRLDGVYLVAEDPTRPPAAVLRR